MQIVETLNKWISSTISDIGYDYVVKEYIINTLSTFKVCDVVNESHVLYFAKSIENYDFKELQKLGDYTLWKYSIFDEKIDNNQVEIYLGQKSYYACYLKLKKQIQLYELLADELPILSKKINQKLKEKNNAPEIWIYD